MYKTASHLISFVEKAFVEDLIPITAAAFHCKLNPLLSQCIEGVARSDLDNISLEKELPFEVSSEIKALRLKSGQNPSILKDVDPTREKAINDIHEALDSGDVELVLLLLSESTVTLDDAFALHYAAAYCYPKVIEKIISLGMADLNLRNNRGYTALHVAARRKNLRVILALLDKKAPALTCTGGRQTAVSICRRLTMAKDYNSESNEDRFCVNFLETETRRNASMTLRELSGHVDLFMEYLKSRVLLALRSFSPKAKMAMANADADLWTAKTRCTTQLEVDPNESPFVASLGRLEEKLQRVLKTVIRNLMDDIDDISLEIFTKKDSLGVHEGSSTS